MEISLMVWTNFDYLPQPREELNFPETNIFEVFNKLWTVDEE